MKTELFKRVMISLGIAVLVAVIMTLLQVIPPFSFVYKWLESKALTTIWTGLTAGIIAACIVLFLKHRS